MAAYYFYQQKVDGVWKVLQDRGHPATEKAAISDGAVKLSILASDTAEPEKNKATAKHRGPWFADIDCAGDIPQAAQSTLKLIENLKSLDVDPETVEIYASGKKGFHVIVPAKIFSPGRMQRYLPLIYRAMASKLYVVGMDLGVYNGGMGTSWRIANKKREDSGTYRVPITYEELQGMTDEKYLDLVAEPKNVTVEKFVAVALGMQKLYSQSVQQVEEQRKAADIIVSDVSLDEIRDAEPQCIEMLAEGKFDTTKNFNQVAMQFSAYLTRVKPDPADQSRLKEMFIDAMATKEHPARVRRESVDGLINYMRYTPDFKFSCQGMRSVLKYSPCKECPINEKAGTNIDTAALLGIEARMTGYYSNSGDNIRRISSFTIDPKAVLKEYSADGSKSIRTATIVDLFDGKRKVPDVIWEEPAWKSKSNLISMIGGIGNLGFFGTDTDVQKLKNLVLEDEDNMTEIIRVYAAGVHARRVGSKYMCSYVEPDFSVNASGMKNLYRLTGAVPSPAKLAQVPLPDPDNKDQMQRLENGLKALMNVNSPLVVAQLLGWISGCHLKVHIRHCASATSSFPLLSLYGGAGSGKNSTAELFTWLNGSTFGTEQAVFSTPESKPYPLVNLLSTSTTVPRIMDEVNTERMIRSKFNAAIEVMKCSWDSSAVPRGTIGNNALTGAGQTSARLVEQYITAPIIYLSEQEVTANTALVQRSISIHLSKNTREGRDDHFSEALRYRPDFHLFARHMVQSALRTDVNAIPDLIDANEKHIPKQITDRTRHSFLILLLGLDFFQHNYRELGLNLDEDFQRLKTSLIDHLQTQTKEIVKEKYWSNVDTVVDTLAIMCSFSGDPKRETLISGSDFLYSSDEDRVYIVPSTAMFSYKQVCSHQGDVPLISSVTNFLKLIREQPYFETDQYIDTRAESPILYGSKCLVLKISEMKKKGISAELFAPKDDGLI